MLFLDLALHPSGKKHVVLPFLSRADDQLEKFLMVVDRVMDQREIR
jgi:hypothetical protein